MNYFHTGLEVLARSEHASVRSAASGALWQIRGKQKRASVLHLDVDVSKEPSMYLNDFACKKWTVRLNDSQWFSVL